MKFSFFALSAGNADTPLWQEIWYHVSDNLLNNDVYYEHLNVGTDEFAFLRMLLLGLCVGIVLAAFATVYNKRILGGFVRALLEAECLSRESAKTLAELGFINKIMIRRAVRSSVNLRRVVRCREEEEFLAAEGAKMEEYEAAHEGEKHVKPFRATDFRANPDTDHYYIPEELKYMADVKFEAKGNSWGGAVVIALVAIVLFFAMMAGLPYILELINDFVGMITG